MMPWANAKSFFMFLTTSAARGPNSPCHKMIGSCLNFLGSIESPLAVNLFAAGLVVGGETQRRFATVLDSADDSIKDRFLRPLPILLAELADYPTSFGEWLAANMNKFTADAFKLWSDHGAKAEVYVRLAAGCRFKDDKERATFDVLASNFVTVLDSSTAWVFLEAYQRMVD